MDSAGALALSRRFSPTGPSSASLSIEGQNKKTQVKGRRLRKIVNGQVIDLIILIDPDRAAKRPARGMVTKVNGKLESIVEWHYTRAAGNQWRRTGARTTRVDSTGHRLFVADIDFSKSVYAAADLRGPGGRMLGALAQLFAPDVLHAEEFTEYDAAYAGCLDEFTRWRNMVIAETAGALNLAAAMAVAAGLLQSYYACTAGALVEPELLPGCMGIYAAYLGANELSLGAAATAAAAAVAATAAASDLAACMTGKPKPPSGGGGGGGMLCEGTGEEPVCNWILYLDGSERLHFDETNCVCEEIWAT
jgi:hypothetical protein